MQFRKFRSTEIFDGYRFLDPGLVLITRADGQIEDVVPVSAAGEGVEMLDGILMPGLINAHCHLELSHLKHYVPIHTGLVEFLCRVISRKPFPPGQVQAEIEKAEKEMHLNGIVAVGDIGNTMDALEVKTRSAIRWQNFVEVLGLTDARTDENMKRFSDILEEYANKLTAPNRNVLTPHAPYSISPNTFEAINKATAGQIISIHNQESPAEDELYKTGKGGFLKLFNLFGMNSSPLPVTGMSSIRSWLPHFNQGQTILLVHNTYMPLEDVAFANEYAREHGLRLFYCICAGANLYIENSLPPLPYFLEMGCRMLVGTDSYSSNQLLSIAREIQVLHTGFPAVPIETILQWATSQAADAFGWDQDLGSFDKGKKPGLCLLDMDQGVSRLIL